MPVRRVGVPEGAHPWKKRQSQCPGRRHAPRDVSLEPIAEALAQDAAALLIRHHGPVVAGRDLAAAADALEELEATARLFPSLRGMQYSELSESEKNPATE